MLKVKRDDFYELNNNDDDFNLDNVNNLFKQISDEYKKEDDDKEEEDGREENQF